jgi:replicative DNA helicase
LEQLKRDFCDLNRDQEFDILSFEFEMLSSDQVARSVSGKIDKSTKELYSANQNVIGDDEYAAIKETANSMKRYPIFYVDESGTTDEIYQTVLEFAAFRKLKEQDKGLVITLDHALLCRGKQGDSDKKIIDDLSKTMVRLKKHFDAEGMKVLILLVSQLNREIESPDRLMNPKLHFPGRNDIFGSSSLFFASDYVFIIHKPASIPTIVANGVGYGPHGYPLFNGEGPTKQAHIYLHIIKERFGNNVILQLLDNFKKSRIDEYIPENT